MACSQVQDGDTAPLAERQVVTSNTDTIAEEIRPQPEWEKVIPDQVTYEHFQISHISYFRKRIQTVFIQYDAAHIYDRQRLQTTICKIKSLYATTPKISFFTELQYAGYKDDLFFKEGRPLSDSLYSNWLDHYYLGSYDFESGQLRTYLGSKDYNKQRVLEISCE